MSKHTPGPWTIKWLTGGLNAAGAQHYIRYQDDTAIAAVWTYNNKDNFEECRANARLIAAAPEMLELLKTVVADHDNGECIQATLADIERLIAKVEGRDE